MRSSHALGVFICSAAIAGGALAASAAVLSAERCTVSETSLPLEHAARVERRWSADGVNRIHIVSASGPIRVVGTDGGEVRVHAAAHDPAAAPTIDADDGLLRIGYDGGPWPSNASLVVEAPRHIPVTVRSTSGAVECVGLAGGVEVQSLQGDVRLIDVSGSVAADVSAGDVAVRYASHWSAHSAVTCKTLDGAIDIVLPADSSFDLAVDSVEGAITSEFAGLVNGAAPATAFHARIGGGGAPVVVDTLAGSVAITRLTAQ